MFVPGTTAPDGLPAAGDYGDDAEGVAVTLAAVASLNPARRRRFRQFQRFHL